MRSEEVKQGRRAAPQGGAPTGAGGAKPPLMLYVYSIGNNSFTKIFFKIKAGGAQRATRQGGAPAGAGGAKPPLMLH